MRKPAKPPSIDFFLEEHPERDVLILILLGHLSIEYLLVEIIQLGDSSDSSPWDWNFPTKVNWCVEHAFISDKMGNALKALNSFRVTAQPDGTAQV